MEIIILLIALMFTWGFFVGVWILVDVFRGKYYPRDWIGFLFLWGGCVSGSFAFLYALGVNEFTSMLTAPVGLICGYASVWFASEIMGIV